MPPSYSPLMSLLLSAGALALIVVMCRWIFTRPSAPIAPTASRRDPQLGLLVPVAAVPTRADAELLRELLREAGIRAGVSDEGEEHAVLVFEKDLERARELVSAA